MGAADQGEHAGGFVADDAPDLGKRALEEASARGARADSREEIGQCGDPPQALKQPVREIGREGRRGGGVGHGV